MNSEAVHPIEQESYRIMRSRVNFSRWRAGARDVVERMVHATADESFEETALVGTTSVEAAVGALRSGAQVVCDSRMVMAGIPFVAARVPVDCYLDRVAAATDDRATGKTRSAYAIEAASRDHRAGAVWVIGNAPTALVRLMDLYEAGEVVPAAVVGLPVGYVGAAEAKARLWASQLQPVSITNRGLRGGSPVAAAALNAIARLAWP
ncbi:MAG TPA: precorrin-8X methylmutase [Acidimicrobiales bacterium]|nr:precorrin-8X methylmutase [Acidimicrobiales bacterium]